MHQTNRRCLSSCPAAPTATGSRQSPERPCTVRAVRVTLTFDNGPDPATTPGVLDALSDRGVLAYFFLVGNMLRCPGASALAARTIEDGHLVGNHSLTHRVPFGDDPDPANVRREIVDTEALLGDRNVEKLFRPFGRGGHIGPHLFDETAVETLCAGGYTVVLWNSVPRDWEDPVGWVDAAIDQCRALDHAVVVLHDLPTGAMDALPLFLDRLQSDGADFTLELPESVLPIRDGQVIDLQGMCRS